MDNNSTNEEDVVLGPEFKANFSPLENKNVILIIDNFLVTFGSQLSAFIGKKIDIEFNALERMEAKSCLEQNKANTILSNFTIANQDKYGVIVFDTVLLYVVINYLFGCDHSAGEEQLLKFGNCSLKIARKIAEFSLSSLQNSMAKFINFNAILLKSSDNSKETSPQNLQDNVYHMVFKIIGKEFTHSLSFILPENIIEQIIFQNQPVITQDTSVDKEKSGEQQKNEVIDSSVTLVAVLPNIKLKFADIINLKAGDLIPIGDPEQVELKVGEKKAYNAVAGQASSFRVVKIVDKATKVQKE